MRNLTLVNSCFWPSIYYIIKAQNLKTLKFGHCFGKQLMGWSMDVHKYKKLDISELPFLAKPILYDQSSESKNSHFWPLFWRVANGMDYGFFSLLA